MLQIKDTIKFMLGKIKFTLREFRLNQIKEINPPHFHGKNTLELHYVKSGTATIYLGNEKYRVGPNSFFLVPGLIEHSQIPDKNVVLEKYSIYLLYDASRGFSEYLPYLLKCFIGVDKFGILPTFNKAYRELTNKGFGYNEIVVSCFKEIIITLLRDLRISNERLTTWKPDTLEFEIEEMFINEFKTITVEEMAKRTAMSTRDLQRFLDKMYNKSFTELKIEYRMKYATNRLIFSDDKISLISSNCGYSSTEHFSYAFKNIYNITPLNYRKQKRLEFDF